MWVVVNLHTRFVSSILVTASIIKTTTLLNEYEPKPNEAWVENRTKQLPEDISTKWTAVRDH